MCEVYFLYSWIGIVQLVTGFLIFPQPFKGYAIVFMKSHGFGGVVDGLNQCFGFRFVIGTGGIQDPYFLALLQDDIKALHIFLEVFGTYNVHGKRAVQSGHI